MRGGVGDFELPIDAEFVKNAGTRAWNAYRMPALALRLHCMRPLQHQFDFASGWRPQPERHSFRVKWRAEASLHIHAAPAKTRTERAGELAMAPVRKSRGWAAG